MTPLRRRMTEDLILHNLVPQDDPTLHQAGSPTSPSYFHTSPDHLGPEHVRSYLLHLVQERQVSWNVYKQARLALQFLYRVTLGREWVVDKVACPKAPKTLPVVLSPDEMARFLDALHNPKHRALLMTAYAAGLRLSEVARLRVEDIDSRPHGPPRPPGQGAQGPRRDALAAAPGRPPRVLGDATGPGRTSSPDASPTGRSASRTVQMVCRACPGGLGPEQARPYAYLAAQLRHPPARVRHRPADHPGPARAPQLQHHRPLPPHHHGRAEIDPQPVRRARSPSRRRGPAMTRPRLEVAEVIRSCRDAFLRTVRCEPDARATPRPRRPDGLPHGGPGRARPGVPGVRAPGGLVQLVRQPPLPQVPGHGRRAVAGGPGRRPARDAVLPRRLHAPRRPRPDRACTTPAWSTAC